MSALHTRLRSLIAALVLVSPAALAAQGSITVTDFSNKPGGVTSAIGSLPEIRKGITSTVRVVRNFMDLSGNITAFGGVSISSVTKGRTSAGTGFVQMDVTIPETQNVGSVTDIRIPVPDPVLPTAQTIFFLQLKVVHTGQINSVVFAPNPQNIASGQTFEVTVNGVDLGSAPNIANLNCHNVAVIARVNSSFKVGLTKNANCSSANLGPFNFTVLSSGSGDPVDYATAQGGKSFSFGPYQGCVAEPNLGPPVVIEPINNTVINFLNTAPQIITVQFRWHRKTSNNLNAPNNEWLFEMGQRDLSTGGITKVLPPQIITVADTLISEEYKRPGSYTVSIRGKNCGTVSQTASVHFEFR